MFNSFNMPNSLRLKRLRELAYIMDNHCRLFKNVKFNIGTWCSIVGGGDYEKDFFKKNGHTCGTAACALGSAGLWSKFRKAGLRTNKMDNNIELFDRKGNVEDEGFAAGGRFFGLNHDEAHYLFNPNQYTSGKRQQNPVTKKFRHDPLHVVRPASVAARVRNLIRQYESQAEVKKAA